MCLIENAFNSLYPEKYEQLQRNYIEAEWEAYKRDNVIDEIENSLSELIDMYNSEDIE